MADNQTSAAGQPWGRGATLGLAVLALLAGQLVALVMLTWWYGVDMMRLPDFSGDGPAVSVIVLTSTPVQLGLLALFAKMRGVGAVEYLGLIWPRRGALLLGIAAVVALIVVGDGVSALVGHNIVTPFQNDIYRTAGDAGWMALLWFAVVVMTPIGEETMFRGFLFRGWLRKPSDAWLVIAVTALLWAIIHVQYDWYVIGQVFVSGLLLGWLRWASGSTILTILLHGLINFEGMLETVLAAHG